MTKSGEKSAAGFLGEAEDDPAVRRMYDDDVAESGYVMNLTKVWAHQPAALDHLSSMIREAGTAAGLSMRDRGILVAATASTIEDSYCSLAWGQRLAGEAGPAVAAAVLRGRDDGLDEREAALAGWARKVASAAGATTDADLEPLRAAGLTDAQLVAVTAYVAGRIAFSTVNAALGAHPDAQLRDAVPEQVLDAVGYGRPVAP